MEKECLECGKLYEPKAVTQKYCSPAFGVKYRAQGKQRYSSITFYCANCGKKVITKENVRDMRIKFCCRECERKYWKHPHKKKKL